MRGLLDRMVRGLRGRVDGESALKLGKLDGNSALICCEAVARGERKVSYVDYDADGPQALCDLNHADGECEPVVIALNQLFDLEPELVALKDLQLNHCAVRIGDQWEVGRIEENQT